METFAKPFAFLVFVYHCFDRIVIQGYSWAESGRKRCYPTTRHLLSMRVKRGPFFTVAQIIAEPIFEQHNFLNSTRPRQKTKVVDAIDIPQKFCQRLTL